MKFSIKDFFSRCDQIRSFLRIWSHLLIKSLMGNFIFCAVLVILAIPVSISNAGNVGNTGNINNADDFCNICNTSNTGNFRNVGNISSQKILSSESKISD